MTFDYIATFELPGYLYLWAMQFMDINNTSRDRNALIQIW